MCLSGKPICISLGFTESPDPDLSLQTALQHGYQYNEANFTNVLAADDTIDTIFTRI